ncbi:hypothetical protein D8674_005915 [Pyrus ussuriensis x Pyrus communis]|uniref:Uncharacterized protein n=1 Tax=Pyrus ussuriensis x Pyrus communis TaxID=2448454 RepID=A0A5N5FSS3_9ROSA|nr:hypothetical protein D8674_005915 [Pyrus ussuriensis x Pyrus communis]
MEQSTTSTAAASSEGGGKNPLIPNGFSELEINAVELLVQLSGSSASADYSDCDTNNGGDECNGKSRTAARHDVNDDKHGKGASCWKYKMLVAEGDEEEEEEVSFRPRKKRFRSISELYELTEPISNLIPANNRKRKRSVHA